MVSFYARVADEQIFTSGRDMRGDKVIPKPRGWKYLYTYEHTIWQLVSSWHWNLLYRHCALMEKKCIWWKIIQNIWIKFMVLILTGKPAFLILQKCVCLLYAAVPSELLEASEDWVVSPSQITSYFVMVSRLWLAISYLHGERCWHTCAVVVRQPGIVLVERQEQVTSKLDLGFLAWYFNLT